MKLMLASKLRIIKNIVMKRPILVIFDVTKLCNQRCPMCNIWKTKSKDMPLELIMKHATNLRKFGVGYVFLQGGEPLIRKDILDIIDIFLHEGIRPTIISNGILLTPELAAEIAKRECNLAISIDSFNKERYAQLRGADTLDKVKQNLLNIDFLRNKHKGNWSITTTVTKKTEFEDVKAMRSFALDHGFMYAIRPYIHVNGTAGREDDELVYDYKDVLAIFDYMLEKAKKENLLAGMIYEEHINYMKGMAMPECDALNYSFLMKETGALAPCIEFPDIKISLSNFAKQKRACKNTLNCCNQEHPCFYNDAREIGFLIRKKWRILFKLPQLIKQMKRYGNFF